MHPLLDKYLCEKYPKIFVNRNNSPQETCMCWGFPGDGWFYLIDSLCHNIQHWCDNPNYVPKRDIVTRLKTLWNKTVWNWIIYPLIHKLPYEEYVRLEKVWQFHHDLYEAPKKNPRIQVTADQVKKKFGGLCFYYSGGIDSSVGREHGGDYIRGLVNMAESLSYHICETCGRCDDEVIATTTGRVITTCPDCKREGVPTQPRNRVDDKLAKIWKKVNEDYEKKREKRKIESGKRRKSVNKKV